MNEVKINVDEIVTKTMRGFRSQLETNVEAALRQAVSQCFDDGRYGGSKGLGYEIIQNKVEELVLSDKYQQIVDKIIDEELEAQARSAVKVLLHSRTRKHLFEATDGSVSK